MDISILAPDATIEFWTTFDTAIYGSDGMYMVIHEGGTEDTLDFIGSGGALAPVSKGIGTGWVPYSYDLSMYEAGTAIQLEFRFYSDDDDDTGTGFYIDDISIEGAYTGSTGISSPSPVTPVLGLPAPNPASAYFSVPLNISASGNWNLSMYDISGRLVLSKDGQSPFGDDVEMDVSHLSSGIYFMRLSGSAEAAGKLVLLRD
jgi:hypothetical protein